MRPAILTSRTHAFDCHNPLRAAATPPAAQTPRPNKKTRTSEMTLLQVELEDKYRLESKRIYLSGTQALVRLPMLQRERDRLAGLNTAGFISGYRGSPLGMY